MVFYVPYSARGGDESRISATKISHEKRERDRLSQSGRTKEIKISRYVRHLVLINFASTLQCQVILNLNEFSYS